MEATSIEKFDQIGEFLAKKKRSSMFGIPCYKINRKPFIMFFDNEMVCKLFGPIHQEAMQLKGATLFNPKAPLSDKCKNRIIRIWSNLNTYYW